MVTQLSSGAGGSPLAGLVELYSCRELLPADITSVGGLRSASLSRLRKHWDAALPAVTGGPTKTQLLVWLLGDAVGVANSEQLTNVFYALSAGPLEALLASEEFATDDEATVLALLEEWLDKNAVSGRAADRLLSLIRVAQLGSSYLSFLAPSLTYLLVEPAEALFALQYAQADESAQERLSSLGLYDCRTPRYAGPRQQAIPASGIRFEWRLGREGVEALAKADGGIVDRYASFPAVHSGRQQVLFRGFHVSVHFQRDDSGSGHCGLYLQCDAPTRGAAARGVVHIAAKLVAHRWRNGAKKDGWVCKLQEAFKYGQGLGNQNALKLLPVAPSSAKQGSASGSADPLAAWADWLHDGCITGTLTLYPPKARP